MDKISKKEKAEKLRTQRKRGFLIVGLCVFMAVLCNVVPLFHGSDLTAIIIALLIGLAMIFSKDVLIY